MKKRRVRILFDWLAECEQKTLDKLRQEFPQFYG